MRIRAKISYMAFEARMTVVELFVSTIQRCYEHLMNIRAIPHIDKEARQRSDMFMSEMSLGSVTGFLKYCVEFNKMTMLRDDL